MAIIRKLYAFISYYSNYEFYLLTIGVLLPMLNVESLDMEVFESSEMQPKLRTSLPPPAAEERGGADVEGGELRFNEPVEAHGH